MKKEDRLIQFCRELIRIPSPSGHEQEVSHAIEMKMRELGYDEVIIDKYGSVLGLMNGNRPGKMVLLDGHIDHVEVADSTSWNHAPFGGEIAEGRIYGRGASDMKGSVSAMILAAADFAGENEKEFAGTIGVSCTVQEECFEGVSAREITRRIQPDFVIIGEATSGSVKRGQRGRAEIVVETRGVSCHSSNPENGVNAVYHMMVVIEEIKQIQPKEHPVLGRGILELTDIISSPYPGASVVPSLCRATFDRRTLVGEDEEALLQPVEEALERAKAKIPDLTGRVYLAEGQSQCWTGEPIRAKRFFPAWLMEEEGELVQKALKGLEKAGITAHLSHFSFCTNGSHFCGEARIPTIGYGPSLERLAHVRDEYIEISELVKAQQGFQGILGELFSVAPGSVRATRQTGTD